MNATVLFRWLAGVAAMTLSAQALAAPVEKVVDYTIDGQPHRGYA